VPIPPPPTGRERSLAIDDRKWAATPELNADPRYAGEGPAWDELFVAEHEAVRHSFFEPNPPDWWLQDSDDEKDAATSDSEMYKRLPEEMPPPDWRKKGPDNGSSGGAGNSSLAPVVLID
jgi:hypothetical protein